MDIDVVIPTTNNVFGKKFSLYYTIRSILAQSLQPKKIFIVINSVDSGSTSEDLIDAFGSLISIIDGTSLSNNISFARNTGAKRGDSEIIIFMDDDVVLSKNDIFQKISEKMKGIDFYCGANRFWTNNSWDKYLQKSFTINHIQRILRYKTYLPKSIERLTGDQSFHEYSFIGHFGVIKRDGFIKVGGFDESYLGWSYQDTDLMMRLCNENFNYDLMYMDHISIYHLSHAVDKSQYAPDNKNKFLRKQSNLGVTFYLNHFFGIFDDDDYSILN